MFQNQIDGEVILWPSGMTFKCQGTFQIKRFMPSSDGDVRVCCSLAVGFLATVDHMLTTK